MYLRASKKITITDPIAAAHERIRGREFRRFSSALLVLKVLAEFPQHFVTGA